MPRSTLEKTRYVELIVQEKMPEFPQPFGPGFSVAFDKTIDAAGFSEIRLWVHLFVENYTLKPIPNDAKIVVRLMHQFKGGSFSYADGILINRTASYIDGYINKPIIGNSMRILCYSENMPPGPYTLDVTYYLVR